MKRICRISKLLGIMPVIVTLLLSSNVITAYSCSGIPYRPQLLFETCKSIIIIAGAAFLLLGMLFKLRRVNSRLRKENEIPQESGCSVGRYDELAEVKRRLISSEEKYLLLFEKMLNGFFVFEPVFDDKGELSDMRFITANPGFKLQTGLDVKEIEGKTWTEVYKYPNKNLAIYHRILLSGEPEQFETYYAQDDTYCLTNAFKISDNQIGVVFENITEYRQAINKITMLNEELEQRVVERTEELQSVVNELEAFTYTVSHDLKSPLRAIDGYSRIIMEDFAPALEEEAAEMLQNIRNISRDMIEMINKLLQYSTTVKTPINKEKIDIGRLIRSVFAELLSANPGRNIKLDVETELPEVYADKVMLRQVIYNILSNAVKFTKYEEQAIITISCTTVENEHIFRISDNGVGFDMEYSKKLFGIFQRLHTVDEFEGSGIGLVTVKKIIQRHGGRVWIEGAVGRGANAYFTLPVQY